MVDVCLMCEYYMDICGEPECVAAAKARAEDYAKSGKRKDPLGTFAFTIVEEYYEGRSGSEYFLFKGYSEPCEHMKKGHGPECHAIKKYEDPRCGEMYDECNCDPHYESHGEVDYVCDGKWHYYN